jgi:hypothetical protein
VDSVVTFGDSVPELEVVATGPADMAGFTALIEVVLADPRFRPGMTALLDYSALDSTRLTGGDIRTLADIAARYDAQLGEMRCAEVNPNPLGYGLGRMFEAYTDDQGSMQYRVFYGRGDALDWLNGKTED